MNVEIFENMLNRIVGLSTALESERLARIAAEQKVPLLSSPSVNDIHEMMSAMASARKIDAIRAHRFLTGLGLKESKDVVESVMNATRS